ncbi:5'-methylthioadenosine nucleosidase-like isoform X2 [Primulina huaijiensis]|uniref:5'-methylthioadenosine nucleosidase-like isoform X2 n=1 Tax=Primulina huaijiensis TaxID=1492673 RepID=UPI003CC74503
MAPPHDEKAEIQVNEDSISQRSISNVLFIIAMQTEASPLVNKFQLTEDLDSVFPKGVPWVRYHGKYKDLSINIVCPGKDNTLGVDGVGTVSASLLTYASVQAFQPDIIINAGTAGGFKVFDLYGVGSRQAFYTPNLAKELSLKVGKLSTGDSLDMSTVDETAIHANDATVKDMEGAAVAYVADLLKVPVIFLKAVTDIIDGDKPTAEEFLQNLAAVTLALDQTVTQVVDFINGKSFSEI